MWTQRLHYTQCVETVYDPLCWTQETESAIGRPENAPVALKENDESEAAAVLPSSSATPGRPPQLSGKAAFVGPPHRRKQKHRNSRDANSAHTVWNTRTRVTRRQLQIVVLRTTDHRGRCLSSALRRWPEKRSRPYVTHGTRVQDPSDAFFREELCVSFV